MEYPGYSEMKYHTWTLIIFFFCNKSPFTIRQINDLKHQLDLPPNDHQSEKKTIKSKLDDLNNKLAKELISRRFKLEPEQFSPEVTVKHYHASSKKVVF